MPWDIFAVIMILYFLKKWKGLFEDRNVTDFTENIEKQSFIKKFQLFPVSMPVVDGIYIMYIARRYGITAISDLINNVAPGDKDICQIPVGPFIRLVFCKDVAVNLKLLNSTDPHHLSRPTAITDQFFDETLRGGLSGSPYEQWAHQRKVISRVFSFNHFKLYLESINKHCKGLTSELSIIISDNGGAITGDELHDCMHWNLIKIIFDFIAGSECSQLTEALQYAKDFSELKEIMVHRIFHPECHDMSPIWWFHPKRKRAEVLRRNMRTFVENVIKHHKIKMIKTDGGKGNDIRCLIEEMIKHNATSDEIYNQVGNFLTAGHDTLMTSTDFLLHHFACHPEYQKRCREEVDDVMGPYNLCSEEKFNFAIDDLSKLEYLERFIMESLRMAPTFPVTARELKTPLKIDDTVTFKRGTVLAVSPWIVHNDPRYYPQPEVFNPERFLPEEVEKRGPGTFLAFSSGMRNCIGRRYAMWELKVFSAWILRNFEICTEDGLHDVRIMYDVSIKPERRFKTTLKIRKEFSKKTCIMK